MRKNMKTTQFYVVYKIQYTKYDDIGRLKVKGWKIYTM